MLILTIHLQSIPLITNYIQKAIIIHPQRLNHKQIFCTRCKHNLTLQQFAEQKRHNLPNEIVTICRTQPLQFAEWYRLISSVSGVMLTFFTHKLWKKQKIILKNFANRRRLSNFASKISLPLSGSDYSHYLKQKN